MHLVTLKCHGVLYALYPCVEFDTQLYLGMSSSHVGQAICACNITDLEQDLRFPRISTPCYTLYEALQTQ